MRRRPELERGLTFITVLIVLALAAGIYWIVAFGPIYWDDHEVKSLLHQAGNAAYNQKNNDRVRDQLLRTIDQEFGYDGEDQYGRHARLLKLEFDPQNDLVLTRTETPPLIRIDLRYARTFTLPLFGSQRRVSFDDHIEQDLSQVRW